MYIRKDEEKIRSSITENLIHYKALANAWKNVEIKKKKDGSEYKELTKSCLVGATGDKIPLYPTNSADGYIISSPQIKINTCSEAGYVNDSIFITDEWKDGMNEERKICIQFHYAFQYNSAEEIREKIQNRIIELENLVRECEDALDNLHEVYELYVTGLKEVEDRTIKNCKGNGSLQNAFYDIVSMTCHK